MSAGAIDESASIQGESPDWLDRGVHASRDLALRGPKYLDMIDDRGASGETRGNLTRQRPFMLAGDGPPQKHLPASYHDANLARVDFAMTMHFVLDATAQLGFGWGNLVHPETRI